MTLAGGVGWTDSIAAGRTVGGWLAATPIFILWCCLAETIVGGGVCAGKDGGVGGGEVSGGSPLNDCRAWSSRWTIAVIGGIAGTNGGTWRGE